MIRRPKNLLFANTATLKPTKSALARTRRVRSQPAHNARKIGVFDISANAGLLFDVLDLINRRQEAVAFYPVETRVPMGIGIIGEQYRKDMQQAGIVPTKDDWLELQQNIAVGDYIPFLVETRKKVDVDIMVGLFKPMLAWSDVVQSGKKDYHWNYFSFGEGQHVAVSVFGVREFAKQAGRPFEAAVALMILAQVWAILYGVDYHAESRGCPFDFCRNRSDLVGTIKKMQLCDESLQAIPEAERSEVEKCLQAIRDYSR